MATFRRIAPPIRWAQRTSSHGGQAAKPGTPKFAGLRLEQTIAARLPTAVRGQWFKFKDADGVGYCQTDLLLRRADGSILVIECKHSYHTYYFGQLYYLYMPIVSHVYQCPAAGLLLTSKNWEAKLASLEL